METLQIASVEKPVDNPAILLTFTQNRFCWTREDVAHAGDLDGDALRGIHRRVASAFPVSPGARNRRGINSTDWIPIERGLYDQCLDPRDYRPKKT